MFFCWVRISWCLMEILILIHKSPHPTTTTTTTHALLVGFHLLLNKTSTHALKLVWIPQLDTILIRLLSVFYVMKSVQYPFSLTLLYSPKIKLKKIHFLFRIWRFMKLWWCFVACPFFLLALNSKSGLHFWVNGPILKPDKQRSIRENGACGTPLKSL